MYSYNRNKVGASAADLPVIKNIQRALEELNLAETGKMLDEASNVIYKAKQSVRVLEQAAKRIKNPNTKDFLTSRLNGLKNETRDRAFVSGVRGLLEELKTFM